MSLPNSANLPVEKQHTNIYTMMLVLSFIALVTGCVLFAMEWNRFDSATPWVTTSANAPPPPPVAR